ncbi:hypothetical protein Q3G72_017681 [Acer saccharum]|nr:hypothetical protein Q3G72_017681 [Acer saccharum]
MGFKGVGYVVRWSSSAGPAQPTSADHPVVCRWSCVGPHQRKATSANRPVVLRWSSACVSAGRQAPVRNCACALVMRLSSSAMPPKHRAISGCFSSLRSKSWGLRVLRPQANWNRVANKGPLGRSEGLQTGVLDEVYIGCKLHFN